MRIERYLALLAATFITAFSANAQTASFLNVPQDAKELAMGGVNAAEDAGFVLEDATMDASVSYFRWNPKGAGSNLINVDLGYKLGNLAILAEAKVNGYGSYPVYDATGASSGEYTPNEFMAGIGLFDNSRTGRFTYGKICRFKHSSGGKRNNILRRPQCSI